MGGSSSTPASPAPGTGPASGGIARTAPITRTTVAMLATSASAAPRNSAGPSGGGHGASANPVQSPRRRAKQPTDCPPNCEASRKALFCLARASSSMITDQLFRSARCPLHVGVGTIAAHNDDDEAGQLGYATCNLLPDPVATSLDDPSEWERSYHSITDFPILLSILQHASLLMAGDTLFSGMTLRKRGTQNQSQPSGASVWTYPTVEGAQSAAKDVELGSEKFRVLLGLRQKKGTYDICRNGEFKLWKTNRRGTIRIVQILVSVKKSGGLFQNPSFPLIPPVPRSITCQNGYWSRAKKFLRDILKFPEGIFHPKNDDCFCDDCHAGGESPYVIKNGERLVFPGGYAQVGLATDPLFEKMNEGLGDWPLAFHVCRPENALEIVGMRTILLPGDLLPCGRGLMSKTERNYYLTPTMDCAEDVISAKNIGGMSVNTAILFKVRPHSYKKRAHLVGGQRRRYNNLASDGEAVWYSNRRGCLHPIAVIVRLS